MGRRSLALLLGPIVLAGALVSPGSVAASSPVKVVVIVGPVGSLTSSYISDARSVAATALRYTPNVVQIYSPNATWAAVKPALQGASIVVYMGHGNGFPSPYRPTLYPPGQDGLGLNPVAGGDNSTTQYYGESILAANVRLAPNAIVLLHHLCYASGNSEPGMPEPTLDVAQQRVDNFGAGWLETGARAVIADAHYGSDYYINALFGTDETVDAMWRGAPAVQGNFMAFSSTRTPGALGEMDPNTPTSGFYRSLVGDPTLRTTAVTGGTSGGTSGGAGLAAPGTAVVAVDGAGLYADPTLTSVAGSPGPVATLPAGTSLRLITVAGIAPDGSTVFQVVTADGTESGFMSATALARPAVPALVIGDVSAAPAVISPNGDGRDDAVRVSALLSAAATWSVTFSTASGAVLAQSSGSGSLVSATWDGRAGGAQVPDATYRWTISASDPASGASAASGGVVRVDVTPPLLVPTTPTSLVPATFSPNGDGIADRIATGVTSSEAGTLDATVATASGQVVTTFGVPLKVGANTVTWDGRSSTGTIVPDGSYVLSIVPRDVAGNQGAALTRALDVYSAVVASPAAPGIIDPADPNHLAPASTTLGFALASPATVSWTVSDAAGRTIVTHLAGASLAPSSYAFAWNGRDASGAIVPSGTYYSNVVATNGAQTLRTRMPFTVGAFAVAPSLSSPARGQILTVVVTSAEPLRTNPRLTVAQPGVAARAFTLARSGSTYRVTFVIARTGSAGRLVLRVSGVDRAGVARSSSVTLALR